MARFHAAVAKIAKAMTQRHRFVMPDSPIETIEFFRNALTDEEEFIFPGLGKVILTNLMIHKNRTIRVEMIRLD